MTAQRHYEIVFLVHPDQSEQVPDMIVRYKEMVTTAGGGVHRVEDWGRRLLAYTLKDVHKAHYVMLNIECNLDTLREIEKNFRFNDSILRHLVIRRKHAITEESYLAKAKAEEDRLDAEREAREAAKAAEAEKNAAAEADAAEKAATDDALQADKTDDNAEGETAADESADAPEPAPEPQTEEEK